MRLPTVPSRPRRRLAMLLAAAAALALGSGTVASPGVAAQSAAAPAARPFTVEYYYKIRWGHFDEWMELYKRNHYPILERQQRMGRIVSMSVAYPFNHAGEANRWDMRFTIVWKDAATAHDDFDADAIVKELYPDRAKFQAEERRRFELLEEHMDVEVTVEDPGTWRK